MSEPMNSRKAAELGLWTAAACILNYIESMFPLIPVIPGARVGLTNLVVLFLLYRYGCKEAALVSVVRILAGGILFGNLFGILYSFAGSVVSLPVMILCKRSGWFSLIGVSAAGSTGFQTGQIMAAICILRTPSLAYYLGPLLLAGLVAGVVTGTGAALMLRYLEHARAAE